VVDELTMDQVNELVEYWHVSPPTHLLMKGLAQYQAPSQRPSTEAEVRELAAMFRRN
jgi:hypothetical protein